MVTWRDRTFWSIARDCDMARISGFDERGSEYFMCIETGAGYRERRNACVVRIMEWIEEGKDSGEVS